MQFGKFSIELLNTGIFALDGGAMFGVVPKILWSKAYSRGDESNRIPLSAQPMLIRYDHKVILVDTGNGTKLSDRLCEIYGIDKSKSDIVRALAKFNVKAEDVTDVILTHLHFDHAGGGTTSDGKEIVPTFGNAKYYVQKSHFDWALNPSEKDRASFFRDNYMPLLNNSVLEFTENESEIFPGIRVLPVNGHTEGMQLVKLDSEGKTILYCADLCATSAHVPIPYIMGYDNYPMKTLEEKKRIITRAHEENWLMVYEHDAFVQASYIEKNDRGYFAAEKVIISEFGE